MTPWMPRLLLALLVTAAPACASPSAQCDCKRAPGEQASSKRPPAENTLRPEEVKSLRHAGAKILGADAALDAHQGQRVILTGTAENAKLGAVVLSPQGAVYLADKPSWPADANILGEQVEVSGVLERVDTRARRAPDGSITQGTQGVSWFLQDTRYHLLTLD